VEREREREREREGEREGERGRENYIRKEKKSTTQKIQEHRIH
jgi:hypothetical protein